MGGQPLKSSKNSEYVPTMTHPIEPFVGLPLRAGASKASADESLTVFTVYESLAGGVEVCVAATTKQFQFIFHSPLPLEPETCSLDFSTVNLAFQQPT